MPIFMSLAIVLSEPGQPGQPGREPGHAFFNPSTASLVFSFLERIKRYLTTSKEQKPNRQPGLPQGSKTQLRIQRFP